MTFLPSFDAPIKASSTSTPRRSGPKPQRPISTSTPPSTSIPVSSSLPTSTSLAFNNFVHIFKPSPLLVKRLQHPLVFPKFSHFLGPHVSQADTFSLI